MTIKKSNDIHTVFLTLVLLLIQPSFYTAKAVYESTSGVARTSDSEDDKDYSSYQPPSQSSEELNSDSYQYSEATDIYDEDSATDEDIKALLGAKSAEDERTEQEYQNIQSNQQANLNSVAGYDYDSSSSTAEGDAGTYGGIEDAPGNTASDFKAVSCPIRDGWLSLDSEKYRMFKFEADIGPQDRNKAIKKCQEESSKLLFLDSYEELKKLAVIMDKCDVEMVPLGLTLNSENKHEWITGKVGISDSNLKANTEDRAGKTCYWLRQDIKKARGRACSRQVTGFVCKKVSAIDGGFGKWSEWSKCSAKCGGGSQTRTRACDSPAPANGGKSCDGDTAETQQCNQQPCPVDGKWGDWTTWPECSKKCGGGTKKRTRTCTPPQHGGAECVGSPSETEDCNTHHCPVDGLWGDWTAWTACSKKCDKGIKSRTRICTPPQHGGAECVGSASETEDCNTHHCPVDGVWGEWSDWHTCSRECGGGTTSRTRTCTPPQHGGAECVGSASETDECNTHYCAVDGVWSEWTAWNDCSKECGGGTTSRTRTCTPPQHGGEECVGSSTETDDCNSHYCPVDGVLSDWSDWSACSKDCGGGKKTRTRSCTEPQHGGEPCPGSTSESQDCNTHACHSCEDVVKGEKNIPGGTVINIAKCGVRYSIKSLEEAKTICQRNGNMVVATLYHLKDARRLGMKTCQCGWLANGAVRYLTGECGSSNNLATCPASAMGYWGGPGWNVFCFKNCEGQANCETCEDAVRAEKAIPGGTIMNVAECGIRYITTSVDEAKEICKRNGGMVLATLDQLHHARRFGMSVCRCGWLADGSVKYLTGACGARFGMATCPASAMGYWGGPGWNTYCFKSCGEGQVSCKRCEDVIQKEKDIVGGTIMNIAECGVRYAITSLDEAREVCRRNGNLILATVDQLKDAHRLGFDLCKCGWLSDGSSMWPNTNNRTGGCGTVNAMNNCPRSQMGTWNGAGWNTWCFRTCQNGGSCEECTDVVRAEMAITGGTVKNIAECGVRYVVTSLAEAELICKRNGNSRVATSAQLVEAHARGLGICRCGWLADGRVKFPINRTSGCGVPNTISTCPSGAMGSWGGPGWNAFCFTPN